MERKCSSTKPHTAIHLKPVTYAVFANLAEEKCLSIQETIELLCDEYSARLMHSRAKG
ncbi:hypothetical protein RCJ22_15600 [Vibrio sp. FNV 38]|nr:hypothetical protein [Vibrio sp. FNV 38]